MSRIYRLWRGRTAGARAFRAALIPLEGLFRLAVSSRALLYEKKLLATQRVSIPVMSVGNLSVGGTGKTPIVAWLVQQLIRRGERAAIVLRGYAGDETEVHRTLNPDALLIEEKDRARGVRQAVAEGATIAVLDDAFQHRRIARDEDVVLVATESWGRAHRLLPAGEFRETRESLRRATVILVTRKSATMQRGADVAHAIQKIAPAVPIARVRLRSDALADSSGTVISLKVIHGRRVLAIAGVADAGTFFTQLVEAGADVKGRPFRDHYAFSRRDARRLAREARHYDYAVCTLKDAVKLRRFWPADAKPLLYVLQAVSLDAGASEIDKMLDRVLALRP